MMQAAVQAISAGVPMGEDRPRLLAVTLLTSMDRKSMREVGIGGTPPARVVQLATTGKEERCGRRGGFGPGSESDSQGVRPGIPDRDTGCAS